MVQDVQMKKRRDKNQDQVEEIGDVMVLAQVLRELGEFRDKELF
jgi:hypothetical protein